MGSEMVLFYIGLSWKAWLYEVTLEENPKGSEGVNQEDIRLRTFKEIWKGKSRETRQKERSKITLTGVFKMWSGDLTRVCEGCLPSCYLCWVGGQFSLILQLPHSWWNTVKSWHRFVFSADVQEENFPFPGYGRKKYRERGQGLTLKGNILL